MSARSSQRQLAERFEHLKTIMTSQRFLQMKGLNNDLPFYICEFDPVDAVEMRQLRRNLIGTLAKTPTKCLGGRGVAVLEIDLYDLTIEILRSREGSTPETSLWDDILEAEQDLEKDSLLELLQNVLDVHGNLIPEIGRRLSEIDHDILFLTGIGEVFPYIRSHNILNNLQSTAKDKPMVMFFPGEYRHSLEQGTSLELFGLLRDDKYYRAFNIFDIQA